MGFTGAGFGSRLNSYSVQRKRDIGFEVPLFSAERVTTTAHPPLQPSDLVGVVAERAVEIRAPTQRQRFLQGSRERWKQ